MVAPEKHIFVVMRAESYNASPVKAFTTRQAAESFVEQEKDRGLSVEEVPLCDEPAAVVAEPVLQLALRSSGTCKHIQTHWDRDLQARVCSECLEEV